MTRAVGVVLFFIASFSTAAADRAWQHGTWRDVQLMPANAGAVSVPAGAAVAIGTTIVPPAYVTVPVNYETQVVTIDGADGLRYVARGKKRLTNVIVNDPVDYVIDGKYLIVKGTKPNQQHRLEILSRTRLPQP